MTINVAEAIDSAYAKMPPEKPRRYIGASIIGNQCDAYLALCLRGFPEDAIKPRTKRIFLLGKRIEDIVVDDLKAAGFQIFEKDPMTGRQWEYQAFGGHVSSHSDGLIDLEGAAAGLEIKSMNAAKWQKFVDEGVKSSHRGYYDQMIQMMGLSGMRRWLFVAYNKDTSEYHAEIVEFDDFHYEFQRARIERVLRNEAHRASESSKKFPCNFCFKKGACWGDLKPEVRCSSCQFALPVPTGGWFCTKHERPAEEPCSQYEIYKPLEKIK